MRVFLAGATGAIGRRLVPMLAEAGHEVTGSTRSAAKAEDLRAAGAEPAVCDALDAEALAAAVVASRPEVVINQLTNLPRRFNPRKPDYGLTGRLRSEGTATLAGVARAAGARRLISQSIAFIYAPEGGLVKGEDARVMGPTGTSFDEALEGTLDLERTTLEAPGIEGVVLRYGWFYGPGTYFAEDGSSAEDVRRRRLPVVGEGTGITSFIHVDDAAGATMAAFEHGDPGVYNVCDDEPAAMRDWLPVYAESLGAKPPRRVPAWLAKLVAGRFVVEQATQLRGASNDKVKRELAWSPRYPSWRKGLFEAPR